MGGGEDDTRTVTLSFLPYCKIKQECAALSTPRQTFFPLMRFRGRDLGQKK